MKNQLKNYFKILILFLGVSLLLWNCDSETVNMEETTIIEKAQNKIFATDHQKINALRKGLNRKISAYNTRHQSGTQFIRKYGELDGENILTIKFPDIDNNFMVIVPFKDNKNKLLISYYKEGKGIYKILRNKKYNKKSISTAEIAFLENLSLLFSLTSNGSILNSNNKIFAKSCGTTFVSDDPSICTALYFDSCSNRYFIIDTVDKDEPCNGDEFLDNVDVVGTGTDGDDSNGDNTGDNTGDNGTGDDNSSDTGGDTTDEDCFEYDCEDGGGDTTNNNNSPNELPPDCESFSFNEIGNTNWQVAAVSGIHETFQVFNWSGLVNWDDDLMVEVTGIFTQPLYFQLPINSYYSNGGRAATVSAQALLRAFNRFDNYYSRNFNQNFDTLTIVLLDYIKAEMISLGGAVTTTPPLGFNGVVTPYQTRNNGTGNCG